MCPAADMTSARSTRGGTYGSVLACTACLPRQRCRAAGWLPRGSLIRCRLSQARACCAYSHRPSRTASKRRDGSAGSSGPLPVRADLLVQRAEQGATLRASWTRDCACERRLTHAVSLQAKTFGSDGGPAALYAAPKLDAFKASVASISGISLDALPIEVSRVRNRSEGFRTLGLAVRHSAALGAAPQSAVGAGLVATPALAAAS